MQTSFASQRAKARARQRPRPTTSRASTLRVAEAEPLQLTAEFVVPQEESEAPFAPPPLDDIFGLGECEDEEAVFATETSAQEAPIAEPDDDAPFDPPEFDNEPTFSPPACIEQPPATVARPAPAPPKPTPRIEPPRHRLLPAITIYASWDRAEAEALLRELADDPLLARVEIELARGGLDGAVTRAHAGAVDLFVLDTTLDGAAMLDALDRLRSAAPRACIVILGAVNDIALLRDLAARGVSDYIVPPAKAGDVAQSLCALFADVAPAKVIAVIGARGGIGASTIARNIAWSIAERQQQRAVLADLDLSFGSAAAAFRQEATFSTLDVVRAEDTETSLGAALRKPTLRLSLLAAPATTESLEMDLPAFGQLVWSLRRAAPHVVLDLPHAWEPWVRVALREADEVVIVAGPDLASLRNADNMLKLLRSERDKPNPPNVVVSMSGLPKRPEIPIKDFAEALCVTPALTFAFEPELFAAAEEDGQMIFEAMPDSKAALQLDVLATLLTGHEARHAPRASTRPAPAPALQTAALPVLELVTEAPPELPARRKQRPARTGFVALQEPAPNKSSGLLRTLAAVVALVAVSVWYADQRVDMTREETVSAFSA